MPVWIKDFFEYYWPLSPPENLDITLPRLLVILPLSIPLLSP